MSTPSPKLFRRLTLAHAGLALALLAGILLRVSFPNDIEYKADEAFNFNLGHAAGISQPWPWIGMASGVGVPNPGWSVWVFILLSRIFYVTTPPQLARAVQLANIAALCLLLRFALRWVDRQRREPWLWAFAIACVNPIDVLLQRKIWPQSLFPPLTMLMLMAWWKKEKFAYAFLWGLIGATLGQIHMAGFFYATAFIVGTVVLARQKTCWKGWFLGSIVGAIPLIPWLHYLTQHSSALANSAGRVQWYQEFSLRFHPLTGRLDGLPLQFWWVWITNSFGLGLDYSLHREIWKFFDGPVLSGHSTHLVLALHVVLALLVVIGFGIGARAAFRRSPLTLDHLRDSGNLALVIALVGFGVLLSTAPFFIHRHYLLVAFPFPAYAIARLLLASPRFGRSLLVVCVTSQLLLSASFLAYIHIHGGAPLGDYGVAYGAQAVNTNHRGE